MKYRWLILLFFFAASFVAASFTYAQDETKKAATPKTKTEAEPAAAVDAKNAANTDKTEEQKKPDDGGVTRKEGGESGPTIGEATQEKREEEEPKKKPKYRPLPAKEAVVSTLGSVMGNHKLELKLSGWGGSIYVLRLADHNELGPGNQPDLKKTPVNDADGQPLDNTNRVVPIPDGKLAEYLRRQESAYVVQSAMVAEGGPNAGTYFYPFRARYVTINGFKVDLRFQEYGRWHLKKPGQYSITIVDRDDKPVLKITRTYSIDPDSKDKTRGSYLIRCDQQFENLSDEELSVQWSQNAQVDLSQDRGSYIGDRRSVVVGYYQPDYDQRKRVWTDKTFLTRDAVMSGAPLFAGNTDLPAKAEMAWIAIANRYFATATFNAFDLSNQANPVTPLSDVFGAVKSEPEGGEVNGKDLRKMILTLETGKFELAPKDEDGATKNLDLGFYAGPRLRELLDSPPYALLGLSSLIRYNLGGPCACCTFQPLAKGLLWLLKMFESIFQDWGVAIILLVILVRLILHPITKKSQINMTRLGKQMAEIQPEVQKLKTKYKNDSKAMNQEMMKLYREKGINPMNMLGCLPMFLQMPIWIALYAMLYFAIELRHVPGFYGVFQSISGGGWQFLADLSMADRFIVFSHEPKYFTFLLSFDYSSLNILPIFMGIFWFFQQKLMAPPATNEQAAQQQKIMRVMTLLFPFFLYSAPSGLTLYIMASSMAGMIDSIIVRRHIKAEEEAGTLLQPRGPKPGGLRDRLQKAMQEKQKELEAREQALRGNKGKRTTPKKRKRR